MGPVSIANGNCRHHSRLSGPGGNCSFCKDLARLKIRTCLGLGGQWEQRGDCLQGSDMQKRSKLQPYPGDGDSVAPAACLCCRFCGMGSDAHEKTASLALRLCKVTEPALDFRESQKLTRLPHPQNRDGRSVHCLGTSWFAVCQPA